MHSWQAFSALRQVPPKLVREKLASRSVSRHPVIRSAFAASALTLRHVPPRARSSEGFTPTRPAALARGACEDSIVKARETTAFSASTAKASCAGRNGCANPVPSSRAGDSAKVSSAISCPDPGIRRPVSLNAPSRRWPLGLDPAAPFPACGLFVRRGNVRSNPLGLSCRCAASRTMADSWPSLAPHDVQALTSMVCRMDARYATQLVPGRAFVASVMRFMVGR